MADTIFETIKNTLDSAGITFTTQHHEATPTSQDAARVRGSNLSEGGKALVVKAGDTFGVFVLPADKRLDAKKVMAHLNVKKVRFATKEELLELTGLVPGSVPPFGLPILPLPLYLDTLITKNSKINFNAGSLTDSVDMTIENYLRIANPKAIFNFSE